MAFRLERQSPADVCRHKIGDEVICRIIILNGLFEFGLFA